MPATLHSGTRSIDAFTMFQKIALLFLVSSVKFIFAFPLALSFKFSFLYTFVITAAGGIAGVIFFAFISQELIVFWNWFVKRCILPYPQTAKRLRFLTGDPDKAVKPVPIKTKRRYIRFKKNFGLYGIAILTPCIISIPIGTFLVVRFYGRSKKSILILCGAVIIVGAILSSLVHFAGITY